MAAARDAGWEGLLDEQRDYLDEFWARADVQVDGDDEIQQAVRFALFHVLQAGARAEGRAIPAKGLTGPGYDGHAFWDTETFVLPVLTYILPSAAADALRWRQSILALARGAGRAARVGRGRFPVAHDRRARSARRTGRRAPPPSMSAPTSPTPFVATSDATGDDDFERDTGVELLVETARLWISLGFFSTASGEFRIDGVTGPDEYSAIADNNVYTNLMAKRNLRVAAGRRRPAPRPGHWTSTPWRSTTWRRAAHQMRVPWDERLGVHPQADGFTDLEPWDFEGTADNRYPAAAALPVLRPVPQAGGQAGRSRHGPVPLRRRVHGRAEGTELRATTRRSRSGTRRCRRRAGHHGGRDRSPRSGLRLLGRGRR